MDYIPKPDGCETRLPLSAFLQLDQQFLHRRPQITRPPALLRRLHNLRRQVGG